MSIENKEVTRNVKSARGSSKRGGRAKGSVSDLRRDSDSDTNNSPGLRVSNVQSSSGSGDADELRDSSEKVEQRSDSLTGIERTIAKINAYRSLLNKKIVLKGVPKDLHNEIIIEFKSWVEGQVLTLLGSGPDVKSNPENLFTTNEINTLKVLAAQVQNKINPQQIQQTPPVQQTNYSQPNKNAPPLNPNNPQNPNNLTESVNMQQYNQDQMKILHDMRKLEDMDRNGPQY